MKKILTLLVTLFIQQSLLSFPGDHNSLTCDLNFLGIQAVLYASDIESDTDAILIAANSPKIKKPIAVSEADLITYYRLNSDQIKALAAYQLKNRANIIAAINADIAKPHDQSIVKQKIRGSHDITFEGKPLQVTKWGDSLSDFVNFYGVLTPGAIGDGAPAPPVGGTYGGSPLWIDSWSDYFSIWGQPPLDPVYVRNYGIATYQTPNVMGLMGFSSYEDTVNGWWDITPTSNKCPSSGEVAKHFFNPIMPPHIQSGKSALHSTLMIGGNDSLHGMLHRGLLPTFSTYTLDLVVENVTFMVDWHIENGKKVLLEGTIPGYSGPIDNYDSLIVNRGALCRPLADSFIKPQDIPWWACALGPHVCYAMAKAAKEYDEKVAKSFADFTKKVMRKNKSSQTQFSDSFYSMNLNNFAGNLGDMFTAGGNVLEQGAQDNIVNVEAFIGGNLVAIGTGSRGSTLSP